MNGKSLISLNGTITSWDEAKLSPDMLLGRNWVYTTLNSFSHKPLHLALKAKYAFDSCQSLFGKRPTIELKVLEKEIRDLLYFGLLPEVGNTLNLYLIADSSGDYHRLLIAKDTTPYEGYGLLSVRPRGIITNYEIPFEKHPTNVSLTAANFANDYALAHGYDIAVRANRAGILLSSSDNPLFALRGGKLLTTPIASGARESAERELMFRLCKSAGIEVVEEDLLVEDAATYEELMLFTPVGIQSLSSLGSMKMVNIYASLLAQHLTSLGSE